MALEEMIALFEKVHPNLTWLIRKMDTSKGGKYLATSAPDGHVSIMGRDHLEINRGHGVSPEDAFVAMARATNEYWATAGKKPEDAPEHL